MPGQPLPQFHVESWLPFRNCAMIYFDKLEVRFIRVITSMYYGDYYSPGRGPS